MINPSKSFSLGFFQKSIALCALLSLLLASLYYSSIPPVASAEAGRAKVMPLAVAQAQERPAGCCGGEGGDKPHLLAGSYYSLKNNFSAKLLLNNKGPHVIEVQPTLFTLSGERFDVPPVTVAPNSHRFEDLGDWAALGGPQFDEGSVQVFHRGKDLVLGVQIYVTDDTHSLSFDEKLTELGKPGSARLEGVWWLPSPKGEVDLILSNTTDASLSVSTSIRGEQPKRAGSMTVEVAPHETKVLNVERHLLGKQVGAMSSFGAISIEHNGGPGALLGRAMAMDAGLGYSLPIQFSDPAKAKSNKLQGAGLRIGKVGKESLSPIVVAHNAGAANVLLSGYIPYTAEDGTKGTITLPQVELTPGETEVIDATPHLRTHGIGDTVAAGLEFEHTGELGSVITSAFSVSRNRNQVFRVPLWDIAAQRSATGGYPWYIEGDSSTMVYIKNVTSEPRQYRMYLKLSNGDYVFPLATVEPNQTTVIDVRKLRDSQVPDVNGQTIPLTETRGQVQWSMTGGVDRVLIGRSEQVDLVRGTSSNYACQNCCGNNFYDGWITPAEDSGFQGDELMFIAMQTDANCYGQVFQPYPANVPTYSSSDYNICNPHWALGTTTGVSPGLATISASWTGDAWFMNIGEYCDYTPVQALKEALCEALARRVDSVSPERALIGQPVDVTITGSGFGTGTPTVDAGSGITVSNVELINAGEVRARFTIGTNASPGNHAVSVTTSLGLTTTIPGNFFVQTPYAFAALSVLPANLNCNAGTAGYGVQVLYQVVDNQGHPIAQSGMTPEEIVSSSAGGFSDYRSFATPPTTDGFGRFLDIPVGTCSNAPFNFCINVLQEFRIRIPGNSLYFLGTQANRRDCRDGLRITVTTSPATQTFSLGTVN